MVLGWPLPRLFKWYLSVEKHGLHGDLQCTLIGLTLNAPIPTKVVCFSRLLKCLRSLFDNIVDPDQTALIIAVCSGSTLLASILNLSVMLGNDLQQMTSADDIFRCIFFLGTLRVKWINFSLGSTSFYQGLSFKECMSLFLCSSTLLFRVKS